MPARQIAAVGMRGTAYRAVAKERWKDGEVLWEEERFNGAVYLAGYAIECHLKYAWCESQGETYLPSRLKTHSWEDLRKEADLEDSFRAQLPMRALYDSLVEVWSESLRYSTRKLSEREGKRLYKEITELYHFLKESVP